MHTSTEALLQPVSVPEPQITITGPQLEEVDLSVLIPTYNGAGREYRAAGINLETSNSAQLPPGVNAGDTLRRTLDGYLTCFDKELASDFQLIVLNDGSRDNSAEIAQEEFGLTVIHHKDGVNHGRGAALRAGFLAVGDKSQVNLYTDDDGSYPSSVLVDLYTSVKKGADVAVAYRSEPENGQKNHENWRRQLAHLALHNICEYYAPSGVRDPQAGAKAFSREVTSMLWKQVTLDGWAADRQVLYLARQTKLQIDEVAAQITAHDGSTVNNVRDALNMVRDSHRIKSLANK